MKNNLLVFNMTAAKIIFLIYLIKIAQIQMTLLHYSNNYNRRRNNTSNAKLQH